MELPLEDVQIQNVSMQRIRENLRNEIKFNRYNKRKIINDQLRIGLAELNKYCDENTYLTEKDVYGLTSRIKRRKHADTNDLMNLSNCFLQSEQNIVAFIKIPGGIQVLVKELTGNNIEKQINASETLCNLSLGDSIVCEKITLSVGSYLTTYLTSKEHRLRKSCLWTLQNILISGGKAFDILISMEIVKTLLNIYLSNDDEEFSKDAAIALDIIFSNSSYNFCSIETPEILWNKIMLYNMNNSGSEYILKFIFASMIITENLNKNQLLYLLNICAKNIYENYNLDNFCKFKVYYSIRILGNLFANYINLEFYNLFIKSVGNSLEFFNTIFAIQDIKLYKESLWMLKNFLVLYDIKNENVNDFVNSLKIIRY